MTTRRRPNTLVVGVVLAALLVVVTVVSLASGAYRIGIGDVVRILLDGPTRTSTDPVAHGVFWQVRLPRVALAVVVGASLALAGVIMQGIFRNPLAEPATVGVSAGASVGAVIAIIIGANDIVNPDAEEDKASPLYGMPIFRPWTAKTVFVIKRGKGTGFSGVENPLFFRDNTLMLYGDAKGVLGNLIKEIKALDEGH